MVTPFKPSDFKLDVLSNKKIRFTWKDESSNEDNFYLKRATHDNPTKYEIIEKIDKNDTSVEIDKENTDYSYIIEAFNDAGPSYNPDTIEWYWNDTLKREEKLILPIKDDSKYEKDVPYHFQLGPVQTESETCPLGHKVQYKFLMDQEDSTDWIDSRAYVHTFKSSGVKRIKFKKRCSVNTYNVTDWSEPEEIEVK